MSSGSSNVICMATPFSSLSQGTAFSGTFGIQAFGIQAQFYGRDLGLLCGSLP
jgi:hypothetical protein